MALALARLSDGWDDRREAQTGVSGGHAGYGTLTAPQFRRPTASD